MCRWSVQRVGKGVATGRPRGDSGKSWVQERPKRAKPGVSNISYILGEVHDPRTASVRQVSGLAAHATNTAGVDNQLLQFSSKCDDPERSPFLHRTLGDRHIQRHPYNSSHHTSNEANRNVRQGCVLLDDLQKGKN